jgi:Circularly permutated YpsA SLOG family
VPHKSLQGHPTKIISGGQTGVDRAALDVAIELGISHGGWCPRGRLAEDGVIPPHYGLTEHPSPSDDDRTRQNVADADGTLILCLGQPRGGTKLTRDEARRRRKPCLVVSLGEEPDVAAARRWLAENRIGVLNVAGPRDSQSPGIGPQAAEYLLALLR